MSRVRQMTVAGATFSVALGIGFVMQNGDALAARFAETPQPALPASQMEAATPAALVLTRPAPREGSAAWMVRERIDAGITGEMRAAVARGPVSGADSPVVMASLTEAVAEPALPEAIVMPVVAAVVPLAETPVVEPPVLQAALEADPVPVAPLADPEPDMALAEPECGVALGAVALPAALVELTLSAPCAPSAQAHIHHQGMVFTVATDAAGEAQLTVPALAEAAVFMVDIGPDGGAVAVVTVPDMTDYDRAVLQWQGSVGPEIHALEFGAAHGEAGHVWHGAPRAADMALAGEGGFLMRLGDGAGLNPQMAEVYTFPSAGTRTSGQVVFSVETPVTDETCGRDLAAQTIQVSPGAEPFAFDLTLAVPDCDFTGEILVLRDMILDLTVAAL
jgi:hypothetical protein